MIMHAVNKYVWLRWPARREALARASYYVTEKHRRRRYYMCEACGKDRLTDSDREVDHKVCRIPTDGWDNLMDWLDRTLCDASGLSVLCKDCHKEKSAKEAAERAEHRRAKKLKARKAKKKTRKVKRSKR